MLTIMAEKKKTGRPRKFSEVEGKRSTSSLNLGIDPAIREAIDRFIAAQRLKPSLTEVTELAFREFLEREGFPPIYPDSQKE
jgi:hypothetical protein